MASSSLPRSVEGGRIRVRQVQTNEEYTGQLDVDPNLVDEDGTTGNVIFKLVNLDQNKLIDLYQV